MYQDIVKAIKIKDSLALQVSKSSRDDRQNKFISYIL